MKQSQDIKNLPHTLLPFIWRYLKKHKLYLTGFLFIGLFWAVEMSLSPYLLKIIIDAVVLYSQDHTKMLAAVLTPAVLYVFINMLVNFNFRLFDYINLRLYPEIKSTLSKDMFHYLMYHSHTFFQNNFSGSLTKRIYEMVEIESIISIFNEWFYPRVFALLISSVTLFIVVKPIFGLILFLWAILFVYISFMAAKRAEKSARALSEAGAMMGGAMSDSISNVMSTKLFANIAHELNHVGEKIDVLVDSDRKLQWKNFWTNFIQGWCVTLLLAAMFTALIYDRIEDKVSVGDFALVLMLSISFISSVYGIGQQMLKFSKLVGICDQALTFIRIPHEIADVPGAGPITITKGKIKFDHVTFRHEHSAILFNDLNIVIHPGEKVGLVGYSGGGKSTFIKLILRLLDIQSGQILIDGQNIQQVTKHSLRKQLGTIPQDPDLFHRTIMENIRFARINASDKEVIEAAKKAKCHEFIMQLPEQYQSLVGERGIKLSGGQKQRIAIARAFLKNAPILLLDEATSALDSITERYIQESLSKVMVNKTTIVIAHRLSTLKDMDRILVFVNGKIVEDGPLSVLLKNKEGEFYKLWQMQAEGFMQV